MFGRWPSDDERRANDRSDQLQGDELAMYWGFVAAGYLAVIGVLSGYAWWLVNRGRALSRDVPEEKRRFLD